LAELGKPFLEYLALMSVPLALLVVTRRSLQEHGVSAHRVRENVEFGWGLPITAALFGVFHLLNLPQLYAGQVDLQWGAGVAAAAWGLFFGFLREWSGSVVAPALVHGVPQGIASAVLG